MRVHHLTVNKSAAVQNDAVLFVSFLNFVHIFLFSSFNPYFHSSIFSFVIIIRQQRLCFSLSLFVSLPRSFLTSVDKENMFTLDHFPVWYRRASEYPAGQFLYYTPRQETRGTGEDTLTEQTRTHTHTWTHFLCFFNSHFFQPGSAGVPNIPHVPQVPGWHAAIAPLCLLCCIFMKFVSNTGLERR